MCCSQTFTCCIRIRSYICRIRSRNCTRSYRLTLRRRCALLPGQRSWQQVTGCTGYWRRIQPYIPASINCSCGSHRWQLQTNDELKNDLKDVWKNDQWVRILLLTLCNVCPGFIRMAATMYYVTWVMGQSTHFATLFISLGVVGMMFGSMLAKVLTDRWCKLKVFFWTNIVLALFSCAFYFFDPKATVTIVVLYFLLNILHQIPSPLHWSLMADVDDYGECKTGKRITGISFSGNIFLLKLGLAIAGAMVASCSPGMATTPVRKRKVQRPLTGSFCCLR